jgi:SAM-dependent methyltransferase
VMGADNCSFHCGYLEKLAYADESFDAVFCYGVFMFTQMPLALREFHRVLKPGGRFYLNANSWGWYLHLLWDVPWNRIPALRFIRDTFLGHEQNIVVTESWLKKRLDSAGLRPIAVVPEGAASFDGKSSDLAPPPGYPRTYFGVRSMIEAIGVKG